MVSSHDIRLPSWMHGNAAAVRRRSRGVVERYSIDAGWSSTDAEQLDVSFLELGENISLCSLPLLIRPSAEVWRPYLAGQALITAAKAVDKTRKEGAKWLGQAICAGKNHLWITLAMLCVVEDLEEWLFFSQWSALPKLSRYVLRGFAHWLRPRMTLRVNSDDNRLEKAIRRTRH